MKKIKFLIAFMVVFMGSMAAFGQNSTFVKDRPVNYFGSKGDPVTVTVSWVRSDVTLSETVTTSVGFLSNGVTVLFPTVPNLPDKKILSTQIVVEYYGQTHYAVYPGFVTQAIRENDPQYWIITY